MTSEQSFGSDFIETTDEDGQVHVFEKIDEYDVDGKRYALLIYQAEDDVESPSANGNGEQKASDDDDDDGYNEEVVVMRIAQEEGAQVFEAIEDEDEFQRVVKTIEKAAMAGESDHDIDFSEVELNRDD